MRESSDDVRHKVRALMTRDGLASVSSETKWRELCAACRKMTPSPRFRVHDLFAPADCVSEWEHEWYYHPLPYITIEWMEIELVSEIQADLVTATVEQIGVVCDRIGNIVRAYGYTRPAAKQEA